MKQLGNHKAAREVTTVIIGAGHAGLAMSHCLTQRSIDHVVLERGEVANSWRHERWDSLRLLTPNWQSQLPGHHYEGMDPNGFMSMSQVVDFISDYAGTSSAAIYTHTSVTAVYPRDNGYSVATNRGEWHCQTLVIASGAFNTPVVPAVNAALPPEIQTLTPNQYRNPQQLADGGVLVVGAAASGLQIADEIQRSGRPVTLAVGEHVRMPRSYRGRDILWWMALTGLLDERFDEVDDIKRARRVSSSQLVGTSEGVTLDLNTLTDRGVKLVGRLAGVHNNTAQFSGSLANNAKLADLKVGRLLGGIDEWINDNGWSGDVEAPDRPAPTRLDTSPTLEMKLASGEIKTVLWATGFRPDYSWLKVPVLDRKGMLCHDGGVVSAPGMYVMGLPFLRRRKSSFIYGATDDARDLSDHLVGYVNESYRSRLVAMG